MLKRIFSDERVLIGIGYVVFFAIFWFAGKGHAMDKWTAYFAIVALHGVYAALVYWAKKILEK